MPLALTESRPSCGIRRSAMLMSAMILSRLMTPDWIALGERMTSCSTPSMRKRTRRSCSVGSRWMSEARSWIAWVISRLTYLTIGASSTISLTLERSSSSSCGVQDGGEVVEVGVGAVVPVDRGGDVSPGGDHRLDVHAGQRPDVVDGEDVRRVGHRDAAACRPRSRSASPSGGGRPRPGPGRRRSRRPAKSVRSTNRSPIWVASAATSWDSVSTPCSMSTRPRARPTRCCSS